MNATVSPKTIPALRKFGLTEGELSALAEFGVEGLTQVQSASLRALASGGGAVVFAPTGSGKTFLFVLAAFRFLRRKGKAVILLSTRAQAAEFRRRYFPIFSSLGYGCADSSDARALRVGDFDVAACVYERFFSALPSLAVSLSASPSLVACDDVEIVYDRDRGAAANAALSCLKGVAGLSLLLFSASLRCDDPIVRWSGLPLVSGSRRAVPLRRGVFSPPVFLYEEYNSGRRGEETFPGFAQDGGEADVIRRLALFFHRAGEVTFVFAKDRAGTRSLARPVAAVLRASGEIGPVPPEIAVLPPTHASALLSELTPCGVAVHNADLTAAERAAVEALVLDGRVRTVFCTTTLGTGVNFPVDNVIVESARWTVEGDNAVLRRIEPAEFESLAGRAGRLNLSRREGRAMVVAPPFAAERTFRELLSGDVPSRGPLPPLDERLFKAAFLCRNENPCSFLARSPLGAGASGAAESVWSAMGSEPLCDGRKGKGLSAAGEICVSDGLSFESSRVLLSFVQGEAVPSSFGWCWTLCGLAELSRFLPSAAGTDAAALLEAVEEKGIRDVLPLAGGLDYADTRRLLGAVVLLRLHERATTEWVELNLHVSAGVQQRLARAARSLSNTAARLAKAVGRKESADFFSAFLSGEERPTREAAEGPEMRLLGEGRDRSGYVSVGGRKIRLRLSTYRIAERLYREGMKGKGWVRASELSPDGDADRARKYVSHLRAELRAAVGFNPVENDGEGCYRLAPALLRRPR